MPTRESKIGAVSRLLTTDWQLAREKRNFLKTTLLELGGYASMNEFLDKVGPKTAIVAVVGRGTDRWDKSFEKVDGATVAEEYKIRRGASRALTQVPNVAPDLVNGETVPLISYGMLGVRELIVDRNGNERAKHIMIYAEEKDRDELQKAAVDLGINNSAMRRTDEAFGHAGAIAPHVEALKGKDYVITYFSGDVISPESVQLTLLALDIMRMEKKDISAILPTAKMDNPPYPVHVDPNGIVRDFGQKRLWGEASLIAPQNLARGGSNVGIRIYSNPEFADTLLEMSGRYAGIEFPLDDVDRQFAKKGKLRQLAVSSKEEINSSAKELSGLKGFLSNVKTIFQRSK